MVGRDTDSPPLRAVLLSSDPGLRAGTPRLRADGWRTVPAATGYDAAAEILATDIAALLVDLRSLTPPHAGLLGLAKRKQVPVLGIFGPVPPAMSGEASDALRCVDVADVPAILASLARLRDRQREEEPASQPRQEEPIDAETAAEPDTPVVEETSEAEGEPAEPKPAETRPAAPPRATRADVRPEQPAKTLGSANGLLSPEEIAALLEDEQ